MPQAQVGFNVPLLIQQAESAARSRRSKGRQWPSTLKALRTPGNPTALLMKAQNEKRHQETEPQECWEERRFESVFRPKTKKEEALEHLCPHQSRGEYLHWHLLESEAGSAGLPGWRGKDPCNFPILSGLGTKLTGNEEGRRKRLL